MTINLNPNPKTNYLLTRQTQRHNVSFGDFGASIFLAMGIKAGHDALVRFGNKVELLRHLHKIHTVIDACVDNCSRTISEKLPDTLAELAKTPDGVFIGKKAKYAASVVDMPQGALAVSFLRIKATSVLSKVNDTYRNVQIKKEFIRSLFDNGHEVSAFLPIELKKLNDGPYGAFKQEICDTALFSERYNDIRKKFPAEFGGDFAAYLRETCNITTSPTQRIYGDLRLLSALDEDVHSGYLKARENGTTKMIREFLAEPTQKLMIGDFSPPALDENIFMDFLRIREGVFEEAFPQILKDAVTSDDKLFNRWARVEKISRN